ncbi:peroxisomal trans-2-enoyl-CoA reductase-like isoform X4 [Macrobrachium nipponense]|uniref:peroxisomal trans-2-enoyl-CoA reductase-like isoform X4 n=1 Tax=Macrobrachium nipponense TaxID=159736 RepID=UPI0030C7BCD3
MAEWVTDEIQNQTAEMSIFRPGLFKGKVAIVTGGGSGIGKAITEELVTLGCRVVIASRNEEKLKKASQEMDPQGQSVFAKVCNIRKEDQVKTLVSQTVNELGRIDYLVNNGGGQFPSPVANMSLKGWNAVVETNLTGTFLMCREVYEQWMCENGGVIINIIADMFRGFPMMAHTGAARSAVDNLTKSLAVEWAENGVRINGIAPGPIFSPSAAENYGKFAVFEKARPGLPTKRPGTPYESLAVEWAEKGVRVNAIAPGSSIYSSTAAKNYGDASIFERTIPGLPTKRLGTTQEVASATCFLLSPGASFISGATLKVDGGGSLYSPLIWQIPEHENLPAYKWTYSPTVEEDSAEEESASPKAKL